MALVLHAGDAVSVPIADLIYPSSNLKYPIYVSESS
jgi:hypothetical protein